MEATLALQALCQSAATSYRGNLTPDALLVFLRTGEVADGNQTQLEYAIEEVPAGLWRKALRPFDAAERAWMRRMIACYASTQKLHLSIDMAAWLAGDD